MRTTLDSLFGEGCDCIGGPLRQAIDDGYVRTQSHPTLPLTIFNYTDKAVYDRAWNDVTLTCRGLIAYVDGTVLARPFRKFFNYGETPASLSAVYDKAVVTDKMDGCFPSHTALNLWGGGTVTIGEVVTKRLSVTLVGMDEGGNLAPALVTDWHHNGRKDHWLDIEVDVPVSRHSGAGGHPNKLRVTVNHHIQVNGEYQPAIAIQPGDKLVTQTWTPSDDVVRLVRAALLGDGCLVSSASRPEVAKYQESHSVKQADYVEMLRKALGECAANRCDTVSGYGSRMTWAGSREYKILGDLRQEWYPNGKKQVPADLSWLDDFAVAKWLMDDGHRSHSPVQRDRIVFSTNAFSKRDVQRLADWLTEQYGVSCTVFEDRGPNLRVNAGKGDGLDRLWSAIAPHVIQSMRYKLPERWRNEPYVEMAPGRELVVPAVAEVRTVSSVEPTKRNFPSGRTGFDVTTTTHNYLARGVLVHNSLGILYPTPDGYAVATRGSFASEQAIHATEVWRSRYAGTFEVDPAYTLLFEIVYPDNRVVLDYDEFDDLILLGAVHIETGFSVADISQIVWPGPRTTVFPYASLAEALAVPPRPNAEGFVVHLVDKDDRIKVKQEDYIRLHRILTGLTARTVWEHLLTGQPLADLITPLPDEFHDWVANVAAGITVSIQMQDARIRQVYAEILAMMPEGFSRKDFAVYAVPDPDKWALFRLLDGQEIRSELLKRAKPEPFLTPTGRTYGEDAA